MMQDDIDRRHGSYTPRDTVPLPAPGRVMEDTAASEVERHVDRILAREFEVPICDLKPGGSHKDAGKPRLDLLDPYAMEQMGHVLAFGAGKYGDPFNYTRGIAYLRLTGSALRHIFAFIRGEDTDPESGYPHLAHGMCCLMMLLSMTQRHPELDDRCKTEAA